MVKREKGITLKSWDKKFLVLKEFFFTGLLYITNRLSIFLVLSICLSTYQSIYFYSFINICKGMDRRVYIYICICIYVYSKLCFACQGITLSQHVKDFSVIKAGCFSRQRQLFVRLKYWEYLVYIGHPQSRK